MIGGRILDTSALLQAAKGTPYMQALHDWFLFNPLNLTLPRKFKIAVESCPLDCAQGTINDIGLYAREHDPFAFFPMCAITRPSRITWFPSAGFQPIWRTAPSPITLSSFPTHKMMVATVLLV